MNNQQFTKLRFEMQSNSQIRALSTVCIRLILSDQLRPTPWATTEASVPEERPGKSTRTHSLQPRISSPHQVISSSKYCGLINLPTPPPPPLGSGRGYCLGAKGYIFWPEETEHRFNRLWAFFFIIRLLWSKMGWGGGGILFWSYIGSGFQ